MRQEAEPAPPVALPQVTAHLANGDAEQPAFQRCRFAQLVDRVERVNEDLLNDVVELRLAPEQAKHHAVHARGVSVIKPPGRPRLAAF